MEIERTFVGLDVHALSVVACALDDKTGELSKARLVPEVKWLFVLEVGVGGTRPGAVMR